MHDQAARTHTPECKKSRIQKQKQRVENRNKKC